MNEFFTFDERLENLAREGAVNEVNGFVFHDDKKYGLAAESFARTLEILFDHIDVHDVREAAREKVIVLQKHDEIEEDSNLDKKSRLNDPRWVSNVLPHAQEEAKLLKIDPRYADAKVKFYSMHGSGNSGYLRQVYLMDRYFALAVTGHLGTERETAPIYLADIAFHDNRTLNKSKEHSPYDKQMMYECYNIIMINLLTKKLLNKH